MLSSRRAFATLLATLALVFGASAGPAAQAAYTPPATSPFTDVSTGHVFYRHISWLADRGISTGYDNGNGSKRFEPSAAVLREQMAAFLYRLAGADNTQTSCGLVDVPASHVFAKQICWLKGTGITTGYQGANGVEFRGNQPVLREQMAAFMYRFQTLQNGGTPAPVDLPSRSPFTDVATGHAFYSQIVALLNSEVTTGYNDGSFRPGAGVLREQMAAFMYRFQLVDGPRPSISAALPTTVEGEDIVITSVSTDARYVLFESVRANIVPGDGNRNDVFRLDRQTGSILRITDGTIGSLPTGIGAPSPGGFSSSMSGDGRYVAYSSRRQDAASPDLPVPHLFVHDVDSGEVLDVAIGGGGSFISEDGRYVAFSSSHGAIVPNDGNFTTDAFLWDRASGTTSLLSSTSSGQAGNSWSTVQSMSSDGRCFVMHTAASDLVPNDSNDQAESLLVDRVSGTKKRIAVPGGLSTYGLVSGDCSTVAASLAGPGALPGVTPYSSVTYLWDTTTGATTLATRPTIGSPAPVSAFPTSISASGRHVVFSSETSSYVAGDTNDTNDVFLWDRVTGMTTLVSRSRNLGATNGWSWNGRVSADGSLVFFSSRATNIEVGKGGQWHDLFVWTRNPSPS